MKKNKKLKKSRKNKDKKNKKKKTKRKKIKQSSEKPIAKKQKIKTRRFLIKSLAVFLIALIILVIVLIMLSFYPNELVKPKKNTTSKNIEFEVKQPLFNSTQATAYLPAVDKDENGVITLLVVEAVPGSGRTLVDIDNLLFWGDTQNSIRIAKNVAANISGIDINKYDLVYNIYANASVIGGESAGAAITLATIAALENKSLRKDVVITGTINHDGTIGPVQGILPKAKAAKEVNATLFLVPLLQAQDITYETKKHCEKFGPTEYCTTEQIPKKVNVSEEAGLIVKEVGTIKEALNYFLE